MREPGCPEGESPSQSSCCSFSRPFGSQGARKILPQTSPASPVGFSAPGALPDSPPISARGLFPALPATPPARLPGPRSARPGRLSPPFPGGGLGGSKPGAAPSLGQERRSGDPFLEAAPRRANPSSPAEKAPRAPTDRQSSPTLFRLQPSQAAAPSLAPKPRLGRSGAHQPGGPKAP